MGKLAIKIDVDTYRGTKEGNPKLAQILSEAEAPALFLFSLGPDNTGKALRRIFTKGFVKKCLRSNVAGNYGLKTLMYGTLLPAPNIGKKCKVQMQAIRKMGFECGIHSWNHFKWQDYLFKMSKAEIAEEFGKAREAFREIFGFEANCCGAAGWQCSPLSLEVQDEANLKFCSDTRNGEPFIPQMGGKVFKTLQIPSTMLTLDEMLGRFSLEEILRKNLDEASSEGMHLMTIHSELEGMAYAEYFEKFLKAAKEREVEFVSLNAYADELLKDREKLPVKEVKLLPFEGRSALLAQSI